MTTIELSANTVLKIWEAGDSDLVRKFPDVPHFSQRVHLSREETLELRRALTAYEDPKEQ